MARYPESELIERVLEQIDELWESEALIKEAEIFQFPMPREASTRARGYGPKQMFDPSVGRELYSPSQYDFNYFRPLRPDQSLHELRVVRTEEYSASTDTTTTREYDPNDPAPIMQALNRARNERGVIGTIETFDSMSSTSGISLHFEDSLDRALRDNFLFPATIRNGAQLTIGEVQKENQRSWEFKQNYPGFYNKLRETFLVINNHALVLMAVEKNRQNSPITQEAFSADERGGFNWGELEKVANRSAAQAFERVQALYRMESRLESERKSRKQLEAKIQKSFRPGAEGSESSVSFVRNFLKESGMKFKVNRETENSQMAMKRFFNEYRAFANKKLDDLEHNRGLQSALAITRARVMGRDAVTQTDMDDAKRRITLARKDPGTFTSARKMIDSITGGDREIGSEMMLLLDRRRSFSRHFEGIAKFGQAVHRLNRGDTHIRKSDIEEGRRFAASALLRSMVKGESVAQAVASEFKRTGFSSASALKANIRISKETDKLLNHLLQPLTKPEAYLAEKTDQALKADAPDTLQDSLGKQMKRSKGPSGPSTDPKIKR